MSQTTIPTFFKFGMYRKLYITYMEDINYVAKFDRNRSRCYKDTRS